MRTASEGVMKGGEGWRRGSDGQLWVGVVKKCDEVMMGGYE